VRLRYQWYAGTSALRKQTENTLKLTRAMLGQRIKVKVTGSKTGYQTASRTSAATVRVTR
jgi:hypothetical protein